MSKPESTAPSLPKSNRSFMLFSLIAIVAVAAVSGAAVLLYDAQPSQYACISMGYHGSTIDLTTSGIIHVSGSQYYISCNDGTDDGELPTSSLNTSCLTITPKEESSPYPGAASTYYYYVGASGHSLSLMGASTNSTMILPPTDAYIQVACG